MPTDSEYLEQAGIKDGGAEASPQASPSTAENTAAPQAAPTATEMFELSGNKFPVTSEFSFIQDGKTQKASYNDLVNGYRRASHIQQKWEKEHIPLKTQFEQQKPEFDKYKGFYDKYNALQTWSEQNPDQWKRLEEIWKNKDQLLLAAEAGARPGAPTPNQGLNLDPLVKKIADLENKLNTKVDPYLQQMEQRERQESEQKDIEFVKNEITEFQKEFPEIDLNEKDSDGVSLWAKIASWGTSKGFIEYTPAAMMYLKPRIAEIYALRARSEAMKSAKTDHSQGIVKRSTTPFTQGQSPQAQNGKRMSYAEIAEKSRADYEQFLKSGT